jgi:Family of unknown function (DUF6252)
MTKRNSIFTNLSISMGVLFILASSCNSTPTPTPTPTTGTMSAKINNVQWTATTLEGTLLRISAANAKRFDLRGSGDNKRIILTLQDNVFAGDNVTPGNYDFGGLRDNALFTYSTLTAGGGSLTEHFPVTGNFIVSQCDAVTKTASGTFSFKSVRGTTTDTLVVTNGVFTNFPYTVFVQ